MQTALAAALAALAIDYACRTSTGVDTGNVEVVIGEFCASSQVDTAVQEGTNWVVTIYSDVVREEDVRGSDGLVRRAEVRSCERHTCLIENGVNRYTAQGAVAFCRKQRGA